MKTLESVNKDVLPLFNDTAKELIDAHRGNAVEALAAALAYISGYYKATMAARSLITGQERQITMKMETTVENGRLGPQAV